MLNIVSFSSLLLIYGVFKFKWISYRQNIIGYCLSIHSDIMYFNLIYLYYLWWLYRLTNIYYICFLFLFFYLCSLFSFFIDFFPFSWCIEHFLCLNFSPLSIQIKFLLYIFGDCSIFCNTVNTDSSSLPNNTVSLHGM